MLQDRWSVRSWRAPGADHGGVGTFSSAPQALRQPQSGEAAIRAMPGRSCPPRDEFDPKRGSTAPSAAPSRPEEPVPNVGSTRSRKIRCSIKSVWLSRGSNGHPEAVAPFRYRLDKRLTLKPHSERLAYQRDVLGQVYFLNESFRPQLLNQFILG